MGKDGTGKLRLFMALALPERHRELLARLQGGLDRRWFRPVKPENLHLTLVFLGDTPRELAPAAVEALRSAAAVFNAGQQPAPAAGITGTGPPSRRTPAPRLEISGLGAFPDPGRPRVVWAGLAEESRSGSSTSPWPVRLAALLRRELEARRLAFDPKPFRPHITLAYAHRSVRDYQALGEDLKAFFSVQAGFSSPPFFVPAVGLYKSTLAPGGSIYEVLDEAGLAQPSEAGGRVDH